MDDDFDRLRREYDRLATFKDFYPAERIWWIYLREAAGKWLERHEDAGVRAAFNQLKAFPENMTNERAHWHALRDAVAAVLERGAG